MSSRRDLEIRLGSLNEIKEIMSAMKNLSLMEVHKLGRFLESQRRVIDSIEAAAADLLQFHRTLFPENVTFRDFYLLVGSERGFCGDFNEALVRALEKHAVTAQEKSIVVVGAKLATKLAGDARLRAAIGGASVAEEIDGVLVELMDALTETGARGASDGPLRLTVLHHQPGEEQVAMTLLQPLPPAPLKGKRYSHAPLLYLDPQLVSDRLDRAVLCSRDCMSYFTARFWPRTSAACSTWTPRCGASTKPAPSWCARAIFCAKRRSPRRLK